MRKMTTVFLLVFVWLYTLGNVCAQTLVSCSDPATCTILIYNPGAPQSFTVHTLTLIPPQENGENVPISGTTVTVNYDGTQGNITCDDTWHTGGAFPDTFPEIADSYSCNITNNGTTVIFQLRLHAQDVYDHPYDTSPGLTVDSHLSGTSESSPFCVTDNTTADAEACKWQEQNLNDPTLSQRAVPLNYWVVYARTDVSGLKLSFQVPNDSYTYGDGDYVCMVDVNGDGSIDEDETAQCIETADGYFCPIQAVQCVATYSDPTCPEGGSLNIDTDKCEATPTITCPDGYTYNQANDVCTTNAECPDGGGLNPTTDLCEIIISDSCPDGYSYDASIDACLAPPTCNSGGTYNPSTHKCEVSYTPSCNSPYTYNSSTGNCETLPECPEGSSYDSSADKCVKSTSLTCPDGYSYNSSTGMCELAPTCPEGGTYNASTDRCEATAQWRCPGSGQTYSSRSTCESSCTQTGTCSGCSSCPAAYCNVFITDPPAGWPGSATCEDQGSTAYPTCENNNPPSGGADVGQCIVDGETITISYSCDQRYQCSLTGTTYCEFSDCQNNCQQSSSCDAVCPTGYNYNGSVCVASVTCPGGGTLNTSSDLCEVSPTLCSSPFTYDPGLDLCTLNATCPSGGTLDTTLDTCTAAPEHDCPSGYTYNSSADICQGDPDCSPGYFDTSLEQCRVNAASMCPAGYTFNSSTDRCEMAPQCTSPSTYSSTLDMCETDATHDCPTGYDYSGTSRTCEANPICQQGTYDPQQNQCYEGDNTCPLGSEYACYDVNGTRQCSPNSCEQFSPGDIVDEDTPQGADDKKDDGQVDEYGNCLGTLYIFNGHDMRCRKAGLETGWMNCCSQDETWFGLGECDGEEEQLVTQRKKGLCHYVDTYCSKSLPLIGCVQHKKTYCCFNSKLGRIIQEQGRPQLKSFGPTGDWGSGKHPNCRGFTTDEFQMLDFDRMDLSEWYGDIVTATQQKIGNTLQNKIQNFYDSTQ